MTPALALLLALAPAQPPAVLGPVGTEAFRSVLAERGIKPLTDLRLLDDAPRTLLIVLGRADREDLEFNPDSLRAFVERGGAVLLATDQPAEPAWDLAFGFRVAGAPVATDTAQDRYRGDDPDLRYRDFPLARPNGALGAALFAGTGGSIATNRPTFINRRNPALGVVATLPASSVYPGARGINLGGRFFSFTPTFALAGEIGDGKLLAVADHSVFINGMILQPDCGNFEFACNAVDWLAAREGNQPRDLCLFLDNGRVEPTFPPLADFPDVPLPSLNQMVRAADVLVTGMERENAFNRAILSAVPLPRLLSALAVLATLAVFAGGLAAFWMARHTPPPAGRPTPVSGSLFERRLAEQTLRGDVAPVAAERARAALGRLGLAAGDYHVEGGWWDRRRVRLDIQAARRAAAGGRRVTRAGLRKLDRALARLGREVEAGWLRPGGKE